MVSHTNYNLNANESFVISLTSQLITCFIDGFTLKMKSQSISYLLNGSEHTYIYIYVILDLADEVHSIWDLWISGLQECKDNGFSEVGRAGEHKFSVMSKKIGFLLWGLPLPESTSLETFVGRGGVFNVHHLHVEWSWPKILKC